MGGGWRNGEGRIRGWVEESGTEVFSFEFKKFSLSPSMFKTNLNVVFGYRGSITESPELSKVPSFNPGVGENTASRASPTANNYAFPCFRVPGLLNLF